MNTHDIKARVEAEVSGYTRGMNAAEKATEEFKRTAETAARPLTTLQSVMGSVGSAVSVLSRGAPLAATGWASAGLVALGLARNSAAVADEVGRMADEVGISAEAMSEYRYAAEVAGVSSAALQGGLSALTEAISEDSAALKAMGVATRDATGAQRPLAEVLADVADRFARYEGGAAKAALGQEVFGSSFDQLLPLINRGAAGLADLTSEARVFGVVISDEAAVEARKFNEDLARLQGMLPSLAVDLGGPLVSALREVTGEFLDARRAGLSFMEALVGIGLSDPTKSPAEHIARITKELEKLEGGNWYEKSLFGNIAGDKVTEQLRKELAYWRLQLNGDGDARDPMDRRANASTAAPAVPDKPTATRTARTRTRTASQPREDLNAGFDTAAAQSYARSIESIIGAQRDAERSGLELNAAQSTLYDLMRSPEWGRMPEPWQQMIITQTAATTEAINLAKAQERLNNLIKATPTEQLREQRSEMEFLAQAYLDGKMGVVGSAEAIQLYGEAANTYLGNVKDKAEEASDGMSEFAKNFARSTQQTLSDLLFSGAQDGFDGLVQGFGQALQRMIADAAAAQLMENLFGAGFGSTGKVDSGSWVGTAINFIGSFFADGGAFTGAGPVRAFAAGGAFGKGEVLTRPTFFRFADGGAFRGGVAGEAGPEAALPLVRMANGKLGVAMEGGGGGGATVFNQTLVFQGSVGQQEAQRAKLAAGAGLRNAARTMGGAQRYG